MDKTIRVSKALVNHRLAANVLNLLLLVIASLGLYFITLYLIFGFGMGYNDKKNQIKEIEESYSLTLNENATYEEYETVIKDFYFNRFTQEICNSYKEYYDKDYTIEHIYNIVILKLPSEPTFDNYKTDFYQYTQNQDGMFNVDMIAIKLEGNGKYYEKNMHDLFYSAYKKLLPLLEEYHTQYYDLKVKVNSNEIYARGISFGIAFLIFYILLPLCNKESAMIFDKKYGLAYINRKNGYSVYKWKIILRNIVMMIIPFIGVLFANKYSIIILSIGYLFLDHLVLLFSKNNLLLEEMIFGIDVCSTKESLLFKNKEEEDAYLSSEEGKRVEDTAFMEKLETLNQINIQEQNEEK